MHDLATYEPILFALFVFIAVLTAMTCQRNRELNSLISELIARPKHPTACVAVYVLNERNEILIGLRTKENTVKGVPEWAVPGGKIDYLEKAKKAAHREVEEETGLQITINPEDGFICYSNDMFLKDDNQRHFVTLFFQGRISTAQGAPTKPRVMEPHKLAEWKWVPIDECPALFADAHLNLHKLKLTPKVST